MTKGCKGYCFQDSKMKNGKINPEALKTCDKIGCLNKERVEKLFFLLNLKKKEQSYKELDKIMKNLY